MRDIVRCRRSLKSSSLDVKAPRDSVIYCGVECGVGNGVKMLDKEGYWLAAASEMTSPF